MITNLLYFEDHAHFHCLHYETKTPYVKTLRAGYLNKVKPLFNKTVFLANFSLGEP